MKVRIPKAVRNTFIGIVVCLLVAIGAGVGYVWYTGQDESQVLAATTETEKPAARPFGAPIAPNPDNPVGASVQMISSPVKPGGDVSLIVKTTPTATCKIVAKYNNIVSQNPSLVEKSADDYGAVNWDWTLEAGVPLGTWPVDVTCSFAEKSAMVRGDLVVSDKAE